MRLAVSNIAWRPDEDRAMARLLAAAGVDAVEVAPTRLWPRPLEVEGDAVDAYVQLWRDHGVEVVSMQALLFGRPDLQLFGDAADREVLFAYLCGIHRLAARMGARRLVFGSPGNRRIGARSAAEAEDIAAAFFARIGRDAAAVGVELCIEPNPPSYGCDFVTRAAEGLALVQRVGEAGFGLHLDAAGTALAGDDPAAAVRACAGHLRHFHVSAPQLGHVCRGGAIDYPGVVAALRASGYDQLVSIEMRTQAASGDNRPALAETVGYVAALLAAAPAG